MKRFALTLAAFALTGALAFADDVAPVAKISGEVNSGVILSNNSNGAYLKNYGIDYGSGNQGGTALVAVDLAGANFGYSIAYAYKGTGGVALDHGYGYVKPADGVELYAGVSGNNAPFGDLDDNGNGGYSTSALGAFYSANGFSVGAQISPSTVVTTAVPTWLAVRYALDKVFTVNAYGTNGTFSTLDQVWVTGSFQGVTGLTATAGFAGKNLATSSLTTGFVDFTLGYALTDAFTAGVTGYYNNPVGNLTTSFIYKPYVSYALQPGVLTLNAYLIGDTTSAANYEPEAQLAYTPVAGVTIKATAWYDTNSAGAGYAAIHSNYTGDVVTSKDGQFSAALDAKFAF